MAMKLVGDGKRIDAYGFNPEDILMKEENRGRKIVPTPEEIMEMAVSLIDHGQEQDVQCRKLPDNSLLLTLGFTRCAAARLIRTGFTDTEGVARHDPEFRLRVKVVNCNEKEAFIHNIVENCHRKQTSPVDDAHNQESMRSKWGYTDAQISRLYRYPNANKVSTLKKLLNLADEHQRLVHEGKMSVQAACDLLDAPEDKQEEILQNAVKESNGKIDATAVRAQVRDHHMADADADAKIEAAQSGPSTDEDEDEEVVVKPRNMREINNFWDSLAQHEDQNVATFAKTIRAFNKGTKTVKMALNAINKLRGS